jgi:hypothetical protein
MDRAVSKDVSAVDMNRNYGNLMRTGSDPDTIARRAWRVEAERRGTLSAAEQHHLLRINFCRNSVNARIRVQKKWSIAAERSFVRIVS